MADRHAESGHAAGKPVELNVAAPDSTYDIVIVGGGPAGCATALALARNPELRGARILLVDAGRAAGPRIGECVPPPIVRLLEALGVRQSFSSESHRPCYGSCSSWGSDELGYNDYLVSPFRHGWHLDREAFDRWLLEEVEVHIPVHRNSVARVMGRAPDGIRISLREGGTRYPASELRIVARHVVDASGQAHIARQLGARRRYADKLVAYTCWIDVSCRSLGDYTMLEATEYGWWYAARLPDGRVVVTVTTEAGLGKELGLRDRQGWLARYARTRHIARRVGNTTDSDIEHIFVRACPTYLLEPVASSDWTAVGDASAALDPIASQGIYKALRDGMMAAASLGRGRAMRDCARREYERAVCAQYDAFLEARRDLYRVESRWGDARFWSARGVVVAPEYSSVALRATTPAQ